MFQLCLSDRMANSTFISMKSVHMLKCVGYNEGESKVLESVRSS